MSLGFSLRAQRYYGESKTGCGWLVSVLGCAILQYLCAFSSDFMALLNDLSAGKLTGASPETQQRRKGGINNGRTLHNGN